MTERLTTSAGPPVADDRNRLTVCPPLPLGRQPSGRSHNQD